MLSCISFHLLSTLTILSDFFCLEFGVSMLNCHSMYQGRIQEFWKGGAQLTNFRPHSLNNESFHERLQRLLRYILFTFTTKNLIYTSGSKYSICLNWAKAKKGGPGPSPKSATVYGQHWLVITRATCGRPSLGLPFANISIYLSIMSRLGKLPRSPCV